MTTDLATYWLVEALLDDPGLSAASREALQEVLTLTKHKDRDRTREPLPFGAFPK